MRVIDVDELIAIEFEGIKFVPKEFIDDAPIIEPENRWIPCSERLPKPGYCITSNEYNGVSEDFYYDGHFWNADKNTYEVIAWMPLPEPYQEGEQE